MPENTTQSNVVRNLRTLLTIIAAVMAVKKAVEQLRANRA